MKISPLGALFAILIVGVTVSAVEQQSRRAAYALVVLVLLGIVTFNATVFTQQLNAIMTLVGARSITIREPSDAGGSRPRNMKTGQGR